MLVQPCIRDHDAAAGVEHAQTVRHVVQRRIEPLGEQRHVARGDDRFEQGEAQTLGDQLHREEEENEKSGEDPVIDAAMKHQRGGHRHPGAQDLHDDRARAAEIASEDADHVGDGDRKTDQVGDRVVGSGECDVAPDAEQPDRGRGPGDVAPLPAPRDRVALHHGARTRVGAHHQPARTGDRHEGDRTDEEQRLSGLPVRGEDRCRHADGADEQRAPVLVERVDERNVDLGRNGKLPLREPGRLERALHRTHQRWPEGRQDNHWTNQHRRECERAIYPCG